MGVLADPIIRLIYTNRENFELSVNLLRLGSVAIVVFALSTLTNGVLQGLNQMKLPVIHSAVSLIVHMILLFLLLKVFDFGVYGLLIGNITFALLVCALNWVSVARFAQYKQEIIKTFILPTIASSIMGAAAYFIYEMGKVVFRSIFLSFFLSFLSAIFLYFMLILLLKVVTKEEILTLPKGAMIARILRRLHLI